MALVLRGCTNMALLDQRGYYKPFNYPWAFDCFKLQHSHHWLAEAINFTNDVLDWNSDRLTSDEKEVLTQIFRFFTQADSGVAEGYCKHFIPKFCGQPEISMMLCCFADMEGIHQETYSKLIDTVNMPESEYQIFKNYKAMQDKDDFAHSIKSESYLDLAVAIASYGAFTEGLQLFASFIILQNITRKGKMSAMGQVVTYSQRDETIHVAGMARLYKEFCKEYLSDWQSQEELRRQIIEKAKQTTALEDAFVDLAFEGRRFEGLTPDEVKNYIRYICNLRLNQLGYDILWNNNTRNPIAWAIAVTNIPEFANFFDTRVTEYSKSATLGSWGLITS